MVTDYLDDMDMEVIQELAQFTKDIDSQPIHDCSSQYFKNEEKLYRFSSSKIDDLKLYQRMLLKDGDLHVFCQGCGLELHLNTGKSTDRYWSGYKCKTTKKEVIFHGRLCVKLRRIKELIRDTVYDLEGNGEWMQIDFKMEGAGGTGDDSSYRPGQAFTTYDEEFLDGQ